MTKLFKLFGRRALDLGGAKALTNGVKVAEFEEIDPALRYDG